MKARIVLYHSEDSVRTLLSAILKNKGYEVRSYPEPEGCPLYSGKDQMCTHGLPEGDALILYDRLPRMSGLNFLRVLMETGCIDSFPFRAVMAPVWFQRDLTQARQLGCKTIEMPLALQEIFHWLEGLGQPDGTRRVPPPPDCPLFPMRDALPTEIA
jgi:CheY-like chemotaxis protein